MLDLFRSLLDTRPVTQAQIDEANRRMGRQVMLDTAPVGSVRNVGRDTYVGGVSVPDGAPRPQRNNLQTMLDVASMAPGVGDFVGPLNDAQYLYNNPEERTALNYGLAGLGALPFLPSLMTAYHGTPHLFDAFDIKKAGWGEGSQAQGYGMYFAESPGVARTYARNLPAKSSQRNPLKPVDASIRIIAKQFLDGDVSKVADFVEKNKDAFEGAEEVAARARQWVDGNPPGYIYTVEIPDEDVARMLDWDAPLSEQPEAVREALASLVGESKVDMYAPGKQLYQRMNEQMGREKASELLRELGVPGIKYFDGVSRNAQDGTQNFVVFDPSGLKILNRE